MQYHSDNILMCECKSWISRLASRSAPHWSNKQLIFPCHGTLYLTLPYLTLYLTLPYLTLSYTLPYLIPYLTLPYLTLPYTLPYLTPYLTISYLSVSEWHHVVISRSNKKGTKDNTNKYINKQQESTLTGPASDWTSCGEWGPGIPGTLHTAVTGLTGWQHTHTHTHTQ